MKVFVSSDMEGTAGVVDWDQCVGDGPEAAAGRRLLLAEVNAAIEGALAGGATQIVLNDSHATMRNLPPAELAGGAAPTSRPPHAPCPVQGLGGGFPRGFFGLLPGARWAPGAPAHTPQPRPGSEAP